MKNLVLLSFALIFASPIFAQFPSRKYNPDHYTVIARDGLHMRKAPNSKAKIIKSLLPNTVVSILPMDSTPTIIAIGDRKGFWQQVTHRSDTGYVFSPYLFLTYMIPPTQKDCNSDYRILHTMLVLEQNTLNYDPTLNWYALIRNKKDITFRPVDVEVKVSDFYPGNEKRLMGADGFIIEDGLPLDQHLLIGVRKPLRTLRFPQPKILQNPPAPREYGTKNHDTWIRQRHIPSGNSISLSNPSNSITLTATDRIISHPYFETPTLCYRLDATTSGEGIETSVTDLSKELEIVFSTEDKEKFISPTLEFVGDLNGDGFNDLLFFSCVYGEGCAAGWHHDLFLSEKKDGKVKLIKRAELAEGN